MKPYYIIKQASKVYWALAGPIWNLITLISLVSYHFKLEALFDVASNMKRVLNLNV